MRIFCIHRLARLGFPSESVNLKNKGQGDRQNRRGPAAIGRGCSEVREMRGLELIRKLCALGGSVLTILQFDWAEASLHLVGNAAGAERYW